MSRKKKNKELRFIISFNEETESFDISTPDGHIDYNLLLSTIMMIEEILIENDPENEEVNFSNKIEDKDLN